MSPELTVMGTAQEGSFKELKYEGTSQVNYFFKRAVPANLQSRPTKPQTIIQRKTKGLTERASKHGHTIDAATWDAKRPQKTPVDGVGE